MCMSRSRATPRPRRRSASFRWIARGRMRPSAARSARATCAAVRACARCSSTAKDLATRSRPRSPSLASASPSVRLPPRDAGASRSAFIRLHRRLRCALGVGLPFGHSDCGTVARRLIVPPRSGRRSRAADRAGPRAAAGWPRAGRRAKLAAEAERARLRRRSRRSAPAHGGLRRRAGLRVGRRSPRARMAPRSRDCRAALLDGVHHPCFGLRQGLRPSGARAADRGRPRPAAAASSPTARRARSPRVRRCRPTTLPTASSRSSRTRIARERSMRMSGHDYHPRRRRDLPALLRHHPRRGRPVALLRGRGRGRGAHDPCLRPGRGGAAHRVRPRLRRRPRAARWRPARRSCAIPRWWRTASPARGCRRATR